MSRRDETRATSPTGDDDLEADQAMDAANRLRAVVTPLARILRETTPEPFTPTQLSILGKIHLLGPINLRELADQERVTPPMVSKVVTRLEELSMVERVLDPADGRVRLVRTSAAGARWIAAEQERRSAWIHEQFRAMDRSDVAAVLNAMPVLEALIRSRRF